MTREELIKYHIYVPEKLNYNDVKLHYEMGYKVLAYSTDYKLFCYITHNHLSRLSLIPCLSTEHLKYSEVHGLKCVEPYTLYFIGYIWQL